MDLLLAALIQLRTEGHLQGLQLVVFSQLASHRCPISVSRALPRPSARWPQNPHPLQAAEAMVIHSRQDNLLNTGLYAPLR